MKKVRMSPPSRSLLALSVSLALTAAPVVHAAKIPLVVAAQSEAQFIVGQRFIAIDQNGAGIMVWGGDEGVAGRCFAPDGKQGADAFIIDADSSNVEISVASLGRDGRFVVAWPGANGIVARRYTCQTNGSALPGNDIVVANTEGDQISIAMDVNGNFTVAWHDIGSYPSTVTAQRFDANDDSANFAISLPGGTPKVAVNPAPGPSLTGGQFLVMTHSEDGSISAQRFNPEGMVAGLPLEIPVPPEVNEETETVSTITTYAFTGTDVAMDANGDFLIGWSKDINTQRDVTTLVQNKKKCEKDEYGKPYLDSYGKPYCYYVDPYGDATDYPTSEVVKSTYDHTSDIYVRRYDAAGVPKDKTGNDPVDLLVSGKVKNHQLNTTPSVAMDDSGDFVVGWQDATEIRHCVTYYGQRFCDYYYGPYEVMTQPFTSVAKAVGKPKNVSMSKKRDDQPAGVAINNLGDVAVGWTHDVTYGKDGYTIAENAAVKAKLYRAKRPR